MVGYRHGNGQHVVKLASDYCRKKAVIQHELMHALGFHHEMTRSDRDQFVKINWRKIKVPQSAYSFKFYFIFFLGGKYQQFLQVLVSEKRFF